MPPTGLVSSRAVTTSTIPDRLVENNEGCGQLSRQETSRVNPSAVGVMSTRVKAAS